MKKILILLTTVFLLVACGEDEELISNTEKEVPTNQEETEPTQEELDAQLKNDTIALDFIKANGDEVAKGTKVTISGEVTVVMSEGIGGEFGVSTKENDGFGVYTVKNLSTKEVVNGDFVTVYGIYDGRDESGIPVINVTVIE